ncbi:MAG: hypothetical protein IJ071_03450 [Ruminococcus sp.]|nr:hypothetical protein [Ruminococcus sp.]
MILAIIESFVLNFVLLLVCVINIRNGPVGGVQYYEQPVKERVVELGLITEKEIKRNKAVSGLVIIAVLLIAAPLMVFCVNGAETFTDGFIQLTVMYLLCGLFDRVFIDWYWVGHTKAWLIPGTEDLMPYIHKKSWIIKIVSTVVGYPLFAALISWICTSVLR